MCVCGCVSVGHDFSSVVWNLPPPLFLTTFSLPVPCSVERPGTRKPGRQPRNRAVVRRYDSAHHRVLGEIVDRPDNETHEAAGGEAQTPATGGIVRYASPSLTL